MHVDTVDTGIRFLMHSMLWMLTLSIHSGSNYIVYPSSKSLDYIKFELKPCINSNKEYFELSLS